MVLWKPKLKPFTNKTGRIVVKKNIYAFFGLELRSEDHASGKYMQINSNSNFDFISI